MMNFAYQLNNIKFTYGQEFVLNIPKLNIEQGTILGITGPNGSGKTTLLKILGFLLTPQLGNIKYFNKIPNRKNLPKLRKKVTMLFQDTLLLKRTVYENIIYGLKIRKCAKIPEQVNNALNTAGLNHIDILHRKYFQLSNGEAKRVALASRIILLPEILLLDEPLSNIDKISGQLIIQALQRMITERQITIVISSHDTINLDRITKNIIVLKSGQLLG
jgi:tungstate transport system ATP-binding protein